MYRIKHGGGSGMEIYHGPQYQFGYGLGGGLRRFFRWIIPLVKKHTLPALQEIGSHALTSVGDFAKDVVKGKDIRESAAHHADNAVNKIKEHVEKKLSGQGIKRKSINNKKKSPKIIIKKHKKIYDDIFN